MPDRRATSLQFLSSLSPTNQELAYYQNLTDDQLERIAVDLAARKFEQATPVSPKQAQANLAKPRETARPETFAPETHTLGGNLMDEANRVSRSMGAGASTAALPAALAVSGPVSPAILGLMSTTMAGEGLGKMSSPDTRASGALDLGLAALPYAGDALRALRPASKFEGWSPRVAGQGEEQWYGQMGREPMTTSRWAEPVKRVPRPRPNLPAEFAEDVESYNGQFTQPSLEALRDRSVAASPTAEFVDIPEAWREFAGGRSAMPAGRAKAQPHRISARR